MQSKKGGEEITVTLTKENFYNAGKLKPKSFRGDLVTDENGLVSIVENPDGLWEINIRPDENFDVENPESSI